MKIIINNLHKFSISKPNYLLMVINWNAQTKILKKYIYLHLLGLWIKIYKLNIKIQPYWNKKFISWCSFIQIHSKN